MPFTIVREDLTRMRVDAIVNAANIHLEQGGGVCGAIFKAAGAEKLKKACGALAPIHMGEAVLTPGFDLPARYIIHAAGPVYDPKKAAACRRTLEAAYRSALDLCVAHHLDSVAFPLISTGLYGYPKAEALETALSVIKEFLGRHTLQVYLAVFDRDSFVISETLAGHVESFINEHYVPAHGLPYRRRQLLMVEKAALDGLEVTALEPMLESRPEGMGDLAAQVRNMDVPFNEALFRLIDQKGLKDVSVYKKANIDRKLFAKIRRGKGYMPSKRTILALAIALELNLEETDALLAKAGYTLSNSIMRDVIVQYFILHGQYDIYTINEVLFSYDQPLLGSTGD